MKHHAFQWRLQILGLAVAAAFHLAASSQPSFDILSAGGGLSEFGRNISGPLLAMPGVSYTVQAADQFNGPWSDVGSATADAEGNLALVDSSPGTKGTRFYRVRSGL